MITIEQLTRRVLIESLRSTTCPACGRNKRPRQSLCYADYRSLRPRQRTALYRRLDHGYAEALLDALAFLEVEELYLPPA